MVTYKQALTNTRGASIKRTLKDIKIGEAFKWMPPVKGGVRPDVWCVKLSSNFLSGMPVYNNNLLWTPIEGHHAGYVFTDTGKGEVYQP